MPKETRREKAQVEAGTLIDRAVGEELRRARNAKGWKRPELLELLRQWAKNHLKLAPEDSYVIRLNGDLIKEVAIMLDLSVPDLVSLLRGFAPRSALPAISKT